MNETTDADEKKSIRLPDWMRSKWTFKGVFADNWMFWMMLAISFGVGWLVAAQYYNGKVAEAVNTAIEQLPYCKTYP